MRIHAILHVPFEGPGLIAEWAAERDHEFTQGLAQTEEYPPLEDLDLVVVMGGPMGVAEFDRYPWLAAERRYLQAAIARTRVFGVCLGAQMIADVAGGSVYRADSREIGWYPIRATDWAWHDPVFGGFRDGFVAGHWHSDTFSLPGLALPLLSSDATLNQGYTLSEGRVAGVQFHLEWTPELLEGLLDRFGPEIEDDGPWVATAEEMREGLQERMPACRTALFGILDALCRVEVGGEQE